MKQVLQNLKTGDTRVENIPIPCVASGSLLIKTSKSLISAGTESMLIKFGKANLIDKARQQPDKLKIVLEKLKTDGLMPTLESVYSKLDQPLPLGYCNVGYVHEVGPGVQDFQVGNRVVSNGKHAEVVNIPQNLCAKIPNNVTDEQASFTVLGAIALQGIRLAKPTLGECIVVMGLGLVGLITVQLLLANGCRVLGFDYDEKKLSIAKKFGAEVSNISKGDPLYAANLFSRGRGVDAVIITASTSSDSPMHQAAQMSRKRGRIILVGITGLKLSREEFFKKELTFQVSASYGPGRYDPNYEEKGQDYPIGYVRWTQQRNFEAILDMISIGALNIEELISHKFEIDEAEKAYDIIMGPEKSLGVLLNYPGIKINNQSRKILLPLINNLKSKRNLDKKIKINFLGAGSYATSKLIPAFKSTSARLNSIASSKGVSAKHAGKKYGFIEVTTDSKALINDKFSDAIVITTRHDSHADFVIKAMKAKKHVYVEKPLCLKLEELSQIKTLYSSSKILMVGFNRRFSPQIKKMKDLLNEVNGPKSMVMTINAGAVPKDHWIHDLEIGGGRIIGEACHFIDLLRFVADCPIIAYKCQIMDTSMKDTISIQLEFADGSIGTIHYFSNGSKSYPKERLEVFTSGKILQLDNYKKLNGYGWSKFKKMNLWQQNKGQYECAEAFVNAVSKQMSSPIPLDEIFEVAKVSIELINQKV